MRDNLETYKIWAPDDALWTQWAKPVLFIHKPNYVNTVLNTPTISWISEVDKNTMIIIDLPGVSGVLESLGLAQLGYRPVPLYNGVDGQNASSMIVQVEDIVKALYKGAEKLITYNIRSNAPPVLILDSNRMEGTGRQSGKYDNRWCVFPQDMPSASFLLNEGIHKVIVRSDSIRNDLSHILCRYQEQGIKIYQCNGKEVNSETTIVKPSKYKSLSYRFKVISGLIRNGTGGFGGRIPEPVESSSGGRYYGFG